MDKSRGKSNKRVSSKKEPRKSTLLQSIGWLRSSFEFRGKSSSRKLTVFFCFVLLNISFIVHLHTNQLIQIEFIYFYGLIILLGLGFITIENIIAIIKGRFGGQNLFVDDNYIFNKGNKPPIPDNPDELNSSI